MPRLHLQRKTLALLLGCILTACHAWAESADATSPIPSVTEGFRFSITPYAWFPAMNGKVDYNNVQRVDTQLNSRQVLSITDAAFMLEGEVHYGAWGVMGNGVYSKSSSLGSKSLLKDSALSIDSNTSSWMGIYTLAGTYTMYANPSVYVDALAGARFLNMNSKVQLSASVANTPYTGATTLYSSVSATDAIAGVKGRLRLGESNFFIPFYVDAGGGSALTKFTSQQTLGIGYAFKQVDMTLAYNNMYYSLSKNQVSSYLNMGGPAVAATFRF